MQILFQPFQPGLRLVEKVDQPNQPKTEHEHEKFQPTRNGWTQKNTTLQNKHLDKTNHSNLVTQSSTSESEYQSSKKLEWQKLEQNWCVKSFIKVNSNQLYEDRDTVQTAFWKLLEPVIIL